MVIGHVESSLDREAPLPAKIPLVPSLCLSRDAKSVSATFNNRAASRSSDA